MVVTLSSVRRWRPGDLRAVAQGLRAHVRRIVEAGDRLDRAGVPPGWNGPAAQGASLRLGGLTSGVREAAADAAAVERAVREASDEIEAAQRALGETEQIATRNGMTVGPDGELTETTPLTGVPPEQLVSARAERDRAVDQLHARLEQILRTAADVDAKLAGVLGTVEVASVASVTPTSTSDAAAAGAAAGGITAPTAPTDADPHANAAWWATLSQGERDAMTRDRPELLGGMDGLPASVRTQANIHRLPGERARLQDELSRAEATPPSARGTYGDARPGAYGDAQRRIEEIRAKIESLDAVERTMSLGDRQLLALDTSGRRVKAAVAVGDVDHARNVSVFTPGLTSTVDGSLVGYDADMTNLRGQADRLSAQYGGGSTAAVTWIGYEAPQWGEVLDPTHSVAAPLDAQHAAPALNRFYRGVDASRIDDPHLVALGHSYGSTTTGYALGQPAGVDDTALFGSPGAGGAHSTGELHGGDVYVLEATGDPVADLGAFGSDPNQLPGATDLSTTPGTSPDGTSLVGSSGHSEYLLDRSMSQYNLATIVSGHPERAVPSTAEVTGTPGGLGDVVRRGAGAGGGGG